MNTYVEEQNLNKIYMQKRAKPLLGRLDIELTERCNNSCIHCCINLPANNPKAKNREFPTGERKRILREAESLGCMSVRFTGGEPLLSEDFEELYVFARKLGLKVSIFTNATLITEHLADLFLRIPPLEKIEISVYGMKKSTYEAATCVPGSFEAAWRGINLLRDKKIPFIVKGALLPKNKDEISEFEEWAAKIPWMENRQPPYSMFFDLRCRRDNINKNRHINKLRLSAKDVLKIFSRREKEYIRGMKDYCSKFTRPPGDKLFSCGAGCGGCVDSYGYFQPCLLLRHPDCTRDLKNSSLRDILINFFPKMRQMKAKNTDYFNRCAKCFLKGLCEQCPAKSWEEHGTLDTPVEYLCETAHFQARFLGLIKEEEKAWQVEDWQARIKNFVEN